MIAAADIVARLQEQATPPLMTVDVSPSLLSAIDQGNADGQAFVLAPDERADKSSAATMVTRQKVSVGISVIVMFMPNPNAADDASNVDTVREAIKTALVGWQPDSDPTIEPLQYVSATMAAFNEESLASAYRIVFSSAYTLRSVNQ